MLQVCVLPSRRVPRDTGGSGSRDVQGRAWAHLSRGHWTWSCCWENRAGKHRAPKELIKTIRDIYSDNLGLLNISIYFLFLNSDYFNNGSRTLVRVILIFMNLNMKENIENECAKGRIFLWKAINGLQNLPVLAQTLINGTVWAETLGCILRSGSAGTDCRMWLCEDGNTQFLGSYSSNLCLWLFGGFFALLAPIILSLSSWLFLVSLQLPVISSIQSLLLCWMRQKLFLIPCKTFHPLSCHLLPSCHQFPSEFFPPAQVHALFQMKFLQGFVQHHYREHVLAASFLKMLFLFTEDFAVNMKLFSSSSGVQQGQEPVLT